MATEEGDVFPEIHNAIAGGSEYDKQENAHRWL
jgi:hypothetical protein